MWLIITVNIEPSSDRPDCLACTDGLCCAGVQCYACPPLISQCQQVVLIRNLTFPFPLVLLASMYFLQLTQQHYTPCAILVYINLTEPNFWVSQLPTLTTLPTVIVCCLLLPSVSAGAWLFLGKCVFTLPLHPSKFPKKKAKAVS